MSYYVNESKLDKTKRVAKIISYTLFKAALGLWFCFATSLVFGLTAKLIKLGFNVGWNFL